MPTEKSSSFDELVRIGSILSREFEFKSLMATLVDQSMDRSGSDLAALYLASDPDKRNSPFKLAYKRGASEAPKVLAAEDESAAFLRECREAIVLRDRGTTPFDGILLFEGARSGMAIPVATKRFFLGILYLNSRSPAWYGSLRFNLLSSVASIASGLLQNARMYKELREHVETIEAMERYQSSVFSSMTNLLVTTERDGTVRYFNDVAGRSLGLSGEDLGKQVTEVLGGKIGARILEAVSGSLASGDELLGVEGICKAKGGDLDFSMNVSPIGAKRGLHDGVTILLTDQSRERELKQRISVVTEERRVVKDMFSRYLSNEVVQSILDSPDIVKLGGSDKKATLFFADIRGYTSFSEGRDPQYIIKVLNDYFSEAVEIVIRYKGFIDKFIGDCIMAAWGVPLVSEEEDAVNAVSCAVDIQGLVASRNRGFFRGEAEHLRVGIGMHTGHLVAGNLGSLRKMNYSVIGDTVNVAARLEGVAAAGEIIITEDTRAYLGERFRLDKREAVKVKGKSKPLVIYNVKGKR